MEWKPTSRKRTLTVEEADLWSVTMRDARALRKRGRVKQAEPQPEIDVASAVGPAESMAPPNGKKPATPPRRPPPPPVPQNASPARTPPVAAFEEKERRRLSKNADLIDARLDLHGMRQREAYSALRSFLLNCSVRGHRHVLVITGKGGAPMDSERERDFFREERGVLRRSVPQWLSDADLRGLVVSYTASHVRHGGDGALYVKLRKARDR